YNGDEITLDEKGRIRVDDWEMRADVQAEVAELWGQITTENLEELADIAGYRNDFFNLFGFNFDAVDYEKETEEVVAIPSIQENYESLCVRHSKAETDPIRSAFFVASRSSDAAPVDNRLRY